MFPGCAILLQKHFVQEARNSIILNMDTETVAHYSQLLMDPESGISYRDPAPHNFSFNSPQGACSCCKGLGYVNMVDREKLIPNPSLSIYQGGITALGSYKNNMIFWQISAICEKYGSNIKTPISDLPEEAINDILNGTNERLAIKTDLLNIV